MKLDKYNIQYHDYHEKLNKKTMTEEEEEYLSSCCGSDGDSDIGICFTCKEHCEFTNGNGLTEEEQNKKTI